ETFGETLEALVRPAWERALRALERAVEESGGVERGAAISWRLRVIDGYGVEVAPYVHRRTQKGQRTAGARLNRRRLMLDYGARLSPEDARLAALLPEGEGAASQALLFALVDHPRIGLDHAPEEAVRIDRAKVGLVAEDRGGEVVVTAGVDGAALPPPMLERLRRARPDEAQYLWEEGSRRLTVLDAGPEVRALLASLNRHGNSFPPESHGALLDGLARLALRIPVALPRTIMGEAVPPEDTAVVRLEAHSGGAVRVELRTRPLKDGPSFTPGEGVRDVHVRREARAVHAVRDLAREKASAESLQSGLPLKNAEPLDGVPFAFLISDLQACLHLLATCDTLQPKPELEWVGPPIRLLGARGLPALKVTLEKKRDWFGVLGGLDVQGERVELARLLDAARRQERFVRVNARDYVEIEAALREHLAKLSDHTRATRHGVEVGPSAVEVLTGLEDAGAKVEADPSWQRLVERIFAAKELKPRVPGGLRTELRDYQVEGFRWMTRLASWGAGAVLADDMGLGKTIQALAVLLDRRRLGPALVLAPTSVAFNWIDEAKRFAPTLRFLLFADAPDRGGMLQQLGPGDVLVLSYGLLTRDVERLSKVAFATLVFDEAQTLKNAHTHRFRAARALQGDFKVALSG
ncbi:MAG TPA: SNF2-related protein, partial [Myxococcaceae bacterium]|nr:SNF2-related protein [Myxococcaceae bacterium]